MKLAGYWLAHLAGAAWLLSTIGVLDLPASYSALALALWAWAHLGLSYLVARQPALRVVSRATQQALHGLALLSLILAILNRADGFVAVAAAFMTAGLYGFLRVHWGLKILEDAMAIALIVAFCLLGVSLKVDLPEFYVSAFGLYLCFLMLRKAGSKPDIRGAKMSSPIRPGKFKLTLQFVWLNRLPIAIIVLMVEYPVWAFSHSLDNAHIYYLGGATVALLYLFLISSQQVLLVWTVCARSVSLPLHL
jgi:hypothetical protein